MISVGADRATEGAFVVNHHGVLTVGFRVCSDWRRRVRKAFEQTAIHAAMEGAN